MCILQNYSFKIPVIYSFQQVGQTYWPIQIWVMFIHFQLKFWFKVFKMYKGINFLQKPAEVRKSYHFTMNTPSFVNNNKQLNFIVKYINKWPYKLRIFIYHSFCLYYYCQAILLTTNKAYRKINLKSKRLCQLAYNRKLRFSYCK